MYTNHQDKKMGTKNWKHSVVDILNWTRKNVNSKNIDFSSEKVKFLTAVLNRLTSTQYLVLYRQQQAKKLLFVFH